MELVPVVSSNLLAIGYDAQASELHVQFTSGKTYVYEAVPAAVHAELIAAESKGSHFAHQVRGKFKVKRIVPAVAAELKVGDGNADRQPQCGPGQHREAAQ